METNRRQGEFLVPAQQVALQVRDHNLHEGVKLFIELYRLDETVSFKSKREAVLSRKLLYLQKTTQNYLPSGMFGQAVLLAGLDAPTGGQAQSNPQPVLLHLRDSAMLPNESAATMLLTFIDWR